MKCLTRISWIVTVCWLAASSVNCGRAEDPSRGEWHASSVASLRQIGLALRTAKESPVDLLAADVAERRLVGRVSAEKVFAQVLARLSMPQDLLVHAAYRRMVGPEKTDAKTIVGKWGSSYDTWMMSSEKWTLALHFHWEPEGGGTTLTFPILWDKQTQFSRDTVNLLTIRGDTHSLSRESFDMYLQAAQKWVSPETLHLEELIRMINSGVSERRVSGVRLLAARRNAEDIPLIAGLLNDESMEVRCAAVWALGLIADPSAIPYLRASAADIWIPVRQEVASALGNIGGPSTVEPLAQLLRDKHHYVRKNAAASMAGTRSDKAIPYLVQALGDDDKATRQAALESLIKLGWQPPKQKTEPDK